MLLHSKSSSKSTWITTAGAEEILETDPLHRRRYLDVQRHDYSRRPNNSIQALSERYGVNPKTVMKWKKRDFVHDAPMGPTEVLTDNGTHFTTPGNERSAASEIKRAIEHGELFRAHAFELACAREDIDHRLTKPNRPWTNGQVERMNRTIKEATVPTLLL